MSCRSPRRWSAALGSSGGATSRRLQLSGRCSGPWPGERAGDAASVDLALPPRPVGLAQLELLQLARRGTDQRVADLDGRGALVVRHAAAAMFDEILLARRRPRPQDHEGLDRLAPLLVG